MKVVAIVQARMGSTRLPGKVLMDLGGHPVLEWVVRACEQAPGIDEVWVATSALPGDDKIVQWCRDNSVLFSRGSEVDVLERVHDCARKANASIALRITGDCPFVDPQVIGQAARVLRDDPSLWYCTNVSPRTYPDGLDVQAMVMPALVAAHAEATRPIDRDCVTTFIERNRSRFPAFTIINPLSGMEKERWVLDTEADLNFCRAVVTFHQWTMGPPTQLDILHVLDRHPELREINDGQLMNERYFEALAEEPIHERKYQRSQEAFARVRKIIPLGSQTFSKSYLQYPQPSPLFLSHGDGAEVFDIDGNAYIDLVSALLPNVLGYRDPDVDAAIRRQISSGISFSLATSLEEELAETLVRLIPCAQSVRFGKNGTDVTTAAIRAARAFTGRDHVLICGGYHGWADWSTERNRGVPKNVQWLTDRCAFADWPDFVRVTTNKWTTYAAVIVEPEAAPDYLANLRDFCDRTGTVLIFDEVITGFRFDLGGAQKYWGVTPDLACFGKAMANGMPISAVVGDARIMAKFEPPDNVFYSGTFFGETLSLAASLATIKKLEREDVITGLWKKGNDLASAVERRIYERELQEDIGMSGAAPIKRLKFRDEKKAALFRREMVASGTLVIASHNVCHALGPTHIRRVLKSYDHALDVIKDAINKGDIDGRLAGATVGAMVRTG